MRKSGCGGCAKNSRHFSFYVQEKGRSGAAFCAHYALLPSFSFVLLGRGIYTRRNATCAESAGGKASRSAGSAKKKERGRRKKKKPCAERENIMRERKGSGSGRE